MIDPSLILEYNKTKYHVFNPKLVLTIGKADAALDELLQTNGQTEWAFITASNPFSNLLPDGVNNARFALLKESVKSWLYFEGEGLGTDPSWKPEQSLLVIGINENEASEIGKSFEQNAILVGRIHEPAKLITLV